MQESSSTTSGVKVNTFLKVSLIAICIVSVVPTSLADQEVAGVALEDSSTWLIMSLASAVQANAMTSVAANTYRQAVQDGAVSRIDLLNGLAADYGIGGAAIPFVPATPVAGATVIQMPELAKKSNCTACHAIATTAVGPAWYDVAIRYKGDASAEAKLVNKVANGGSGAWGDMPEIPNSRKVSNQDIKTLVKFVLGLNPPTGYAASDAALNSSSSNSTPKPFNEKTLLEGLSSNQGKSRITTSPTATPAASSKPVIAENSVAQKLRELQSLRKEGLITESEFKEKKRKLLEQF